MFGEDDIKRLKRQEWEAFGQVGKDDAKAIKAAKADERANARAERAWEKTQERGWKAIERAERWEARKRWDDTVAAANAAKKTKATADWTTPAPAKKKRWQQDDVYQDAPAKGWRNAPAPTWDVYPDDAKRKWTDDASYYGEPAPAGCWLVAFSVPSFVAFGLLVLLVLYVLAQIVNAGR